MVRVACTARGWVDSLFGRRFVVFLILAVCVVSLPKQAVANTPQGAYETCQASLAVWLTQPAVPAGQRQYITCKWYAVNGGVYWFYNSYTASWTPCNASPGYSSADCSTATQYTPPPVNPCSSVPSVHLYLDGKMLSGTTFSQNAQNPDGSWVACTMSFTPSSPPILNPYSGQWQTYGVAAPSGNPASTGNPTGAGTGDWVDSSGSPVNPQPAPTTAAPSDDTTPPQTCGGGSCYDPATDQYCSTAGGQQYCVSGSTARSSAGGCSNGATSVTCGGSPSAPLPNAPQTGVTNPAQNIQSSDQYTQANATTGASQSVTVNVYTAPGTTSSSGQKSGDSGPSPASSSSSPTPGSASGGQDCNTPPMCSGDAATCGVMRQEWYAMCSAKKGTDQLHTDLAGTSTPPSASSSANASGLWSDGTNTGDLVADGANQGNYDQSGFGIGTTCPLTDLTVSVGDTPFTVAFSKGCVIGSWVRPLLIGLSLLVAAKITAGGTG